MPKHNHARTGHHMYDATDPLTELAQALRCLDGHDRAEVFRALTDMVLAMPSYDPDRLEQPPAEGRRRTDAVVYYLRFGDRVKIGTTTRLAKRLREIPHDEILAVEQGGVDVECRRHVQFADLRVTGEWFDYGPALREHVLSLP